jgi:hypothetical protein
MHFINRHSFLLAAAMAVVMAGVLEARLGFGILSLGIVVAVILACTLLFRWLGAGRGSHTASQPDLIGADRPVLLMFQSVF